VRLAGIVVARQRPQTAKGYVFVLFEDEDGPINVIVKPDIYKRDRTTIRMEPFVAVRGRLQKDGETINVIAFEVTGLRLASGGRPPSPRSGPTRAKVTSEEEMGVVPAADAPIPGANPLIREDELFPALPGTQEWWPDRGKLERKVEAPPQQEVGGGGGPEGPQEDRGQQKRQRALEEAATERKREARGGRIPQGEADPELPKVREWWGKPEVARKGPFAYLTALRQAPPGTKSWG
jgi:hypothetical protein